MKKLAFLLIFAFPFYASSQIINIPADYSTIQEGIDAAVDGDTVLVQPDTYKEHLIWYSKSITLASLFLTTGDTSYIATTIIDGDTTGKVIDMIDLGFDARLTGFTVINGLDTSENGNGGGIAINGSFPLVTDMVISNNMAHKGAGLYCAGGSLQLSNVTFINNESTNEGGGLNVFNSDVFIVDCVFSGNLSNYGGAINYNVAGMGSMMYVVDISSCLIEENVATSQTSGILIRKAGGDAMVEVMINGSDFVENSCVSNGALLIMGDSVNFWIQDSKFIGNTASNYTAAAGFVQGCSGALVNCLIASNIGSTGGGNTNTGGITLWGGVEMFLLNCTFADNEATYGAGMTVGPGCEAHITNCIFWGNVNDQIALVDHDGSGGIANINYSDIQYGTDSVHIDPLSTLNWGEHNINNDPMFTGIGGDAFSLAAGSPCIDAGPSDTTGMDLPHTDIIGNVRVWDGSGGGVAIIDMGPYEYGAPVWVGIPDELPIPYAVEMDIHLFPNPCQGQLNLQFELENSQRVQMDLHAINGMRVKSLMDRTMTSGSVKLILPINDLPPGTYFLHVRTEEHSSCEKLIVL